VLLDFTFPADIWIYDGKGAWHFVTLPKPISAQIKSLSGGRKTSQGMIPVTATIGNTRWTTSIFRDTKRGAYLLALKASVRAKEKLRAGDKIEVALLIDFESEAKV